jgi:hypothetical protein
MDAAMALAVFNMVKNTPELIDAAIAWLQATKTFIEAINAAQTARPAV